MIAFKIKEEIYDVPLVVIVGTWQDRCDYLEKHYSVEPEEQMYFGGLSEQYSNNGVAKSVIWIRYFDYDNVKDIATLIHEIDHIAIFTFALFNIPILDNSSNHAYIYLKEYFTKKALTKLKRLQDGTNKTNKTNH